MRAITLSPKSDHSFTIKTALNAKDEKLKIAGIMLYWGEGAQKGSTVDFTNSNPKAIQVFLKFLREICGVAESRLRVYLYHHGDTEAVEVLRIFWHRITNIPLTQFSKPYIHRGGAHKSGRIMQHGLIHVRYSDKRLLELIERWITEYVLELEEGAGTKVANWARL